MIHLSRIGWGILLVVVATFVLYDTPFGQGQSGRESREPPPFTSTMNNPYRIIENWPELGDIKPGAAIGIIPDGEGGTWLHHRSEPPIIKFNAEGKIVKSFGDGMFVQAHGFCMDHDGNLWAGDSGPFGDDPDKVGRGSQFFKFTQDGELLLTLGKAGVGAAGPDTFLGPTSCAVDPNGDIMIADGHFPRPSSAQQDGDRLVKFSKDGKFLGEWGQQGSGPGEFKGPHTIAFDSRGRLFVGDRSNNRVQIFDTEMNVVDDWRHFGRPSGLWILEDDTLLVADSESSYYGFRPHELGPAMLDPGERPARNAGWQNGIRIGSAKDGSISFYIYGTRPEGLAADELGNVFAGLTIGCDTSPSGGCLQKWVKK